MTTKEKALNLAQSFINEVGGEDFEQLKRGKACTQLLFHEQMELLDRIEKDHPNLSFTLARYIKELQEMETFVEEI